VCVCSSL